MSAESGLHPRMDATTMTHLEALLALTRLGPDRSLPEVLEAVAQTIVAALGYRSVALSVYRPAFHDYRTEFVHGDDGLQRALLGTINGYDACHASVMSARFERVPSAFFVPESKADWSGLVSHDPQGWQADTGGWRRGDALLVELTAADGSPLGLLSVDEPAAGRRPTDDELELLVAVAVHAASALERAQRATEDARHQRALTALVGLSSRLVAAQDLVEVAERACTTAVEDLEYLRCAVYERHEQRFRRQAHAGSPAAPEALPGPAVQSLLDGGDVVAVAAPAVAELRVPDAADAAPDLSGPLLLVAMRQLDGSLSGIILLEGAANEGAPTPRRRQELRLLADETLAAAGFVDRRNRLAHEAAHDALTGLRNRRQLSSVIDRLAAGTGGVAVLVCDLDRFKATNDVHGHETGDRVLARFADLLREYARASDAAFRLGGEEFCLVLPGATLAQAGVVAERLRRATPPHLAELVTGQTVSIGFAASSEEYPGAAALLAAADTALYEAKGAGRDACRPVVPGVLEAALRSA